MHCMCLHIHGLMMENWKWYNNTIFMLMFDIWKSMCVCVYVLDHFIYVYIYLILRGRRRRRSRRRVLSFPCFSRLLLLHFIVIHHWLFIAYHLFDLLLHISMNDDRNNNNSVYVLKRWKCIFVFVETFDLFMGFPVTVFLFAFHFLPLYFQSYWYHSECVQLLEFRWFRNDNVKTLFIKIEIVKREKIQPRRKYIPFDTSTHTHTPCIIICFFHSISC